MTLQLATCGGGSAPIAQSPPTTKVTRTPDHSPVTFACSFVGALRDTLRDCGFEEESKVSGRASITNIARDGGTAVRLHTEPGDNNVVFSGAMERNDLWLSQKASDGYEGHEAWWAHSILFPDDFTVPTWQAYVVFDFHNTVSTTRGRPTSMSPSNRKRTSTNQDS